MVIIITVNITCALVRIGTMGASSAQQQFPENFIRIHTLKKGNCQNKYDKKGSLCVSKHIRFFKQAEATEKHYHHIGKTGERVKKRREK